MIVNVFLQFQNEPWGQIMVRTHGSFCDDCSSPKSSGDLLKIVENRQPSTGAIPIEGRSQDRAKLLGNGRSYREEPNPTYAP